MSNYSKTFVTDYARIELHDRLNLTGAEISINNLSPDAGVNFIHYHFKNEEIYGVLSGKGTMLIDGELFELKAGDWFHIAPAGRRQIRSAKDSGLSYICIQVKENSLEEFNFLDGGIEGEDEDE